ncbi:MAG: hypothetical protein C0490_11285, partial [Marivirga sp.]|nr:hypothetical protein [Marivirga sp.]
MRKRWLLVLIAVAAIFAFTLTFLPQFFHEDIEKIANREINNRIEGHVSFSHLDISLWKNFPDITISIKELNIVSKRIADDTLLQVDEISLIMDSYRYVSEGHIDLTHIKINRPIIDARITYDGNTNFSIFKPDTAHSDTSANNIALHLEEIQIENADIRYTDEYSGTNVSLLGLTFKGNGLFSNTEFDLTTQTRAQSVSLIFGGKPYF